MRSRIRSSERFTWLALALALAGVASADEPAKWLARMNHALTTLNYDGTFAHWQGGKVEMLRQLEVGVDLIHSERSADIALTTKFDSMQDLQAYQVDPYHANEVAAYMRSVCSQVVAADYES